MTDDLSAKLDVLIKLQATALIATIDSAKEKILFLDRAGLRPILIAEIVGTTANHVGVTLSKYREKTKDKGEGNAKRKRGD